MNPKDQFESIIENLASNQITKGNMMRAPGMVYKGKVFAFFHEEKMCFRLGKDFDPESEGITSYTFLSPFKNKPPMKGWFYITKSDQHKWEELATIALQKMKREIG